MKIERTANTFNFSLFHVFPYTIQVFNYLIRTILFTSTNPFTSSL